MRAWLGEGGGQRSWHPAPTQPAATHRHTIPEKCHPQGHPEETSVPWEAANSLQVRLCQAPCGYRPVGEGETPCKGPKGAGVDCWDIGPGP